MSGAGYYSIVIKDKVSQWNNQWQTVSACFTL